MLTKTLENGLGVAVLQRRGLESVGIDLRVGYGQLSEPEEKMGLAHFLEHMMFKGTKKRPLKTLTNDFLRLGNVWNGKTTPEDTLYLLVCHKTYFTKAIDVLSDITSNSAIESHAVETERNTILTEISKWTSNTDSLLDREIETSLYENKRFEYLAQGTAESIGQIQYKDLVNTYANNYGPKNSYLAIYGAVDEKKALERVERSFSSPSGRSKKSAVTIKVRNHAKEIKTEKEGLNCSYIALSFNTDGYQKYRKNMKVRAAIGVLTALLRQKLRTEVREKRGMSYDCGTYYTSSASFGHLDCIANVKKNEEKRAQEVMLKECEKLAVGEIDKREVSTIREGLLIRTLLSFENSDATGQSLSFHGLLGMPEMLTTYPKLIKSVTLEDVQAAAAKYLTMDNYGSVLLLPKTSR